jgi:hypothetical protein
VVTGGIGCLIAVAWTRGRYPELAAYRGDEVVSLEAAATDGARSPAASS